MPPLPKKVVVGDSDAIVLALICHILNRQGFATEAVSEREELLRMIREGLYDAVIADAMLEGVIDSAKAAPHASRVILTAPPDLLLDGAHATLRKPLEFEELVNVVRKCVTQGS